MRSFFNDSSQKSDEGGKNHHSVPIPFYTSPPDLKAAVKWADLQLTAETRFIAKKIVAKINHVSHERYIKALRKTVADFQEKVKGSFLILTLDELHERDRFLSSTQWITKLALADAGLRSAHIIQSSKGEAANLFGRFRTVEHILVLYDCPMNASHLTQALREMLKMKLSASERPEWITNDAYDACLKESIRKCHLHIGIPFSRRDDRERIAIECAMSFGSTPLNQQFKSINLLTSENIPLLREVLTEEEFALINEGASRYSYNISEADLTYFDHFFPENNRTLPHLQSGLPLTARNDDIITQPFTPYTYNLNFKDKDRSEVEPKICGAREPVVPYVIRLVHDHYSSYNRLYIAGAINAIEYGFVGQPTLQSLPKDFNKLIEATNTYHARLEAQYQRKIMLANQEKKSEEKAQTFKVVVSNFEKGFGEDGFTMNRAIRSRTIPREQEKEIIASQITWLGMKVEARECRQDRTIWFSGNHRITGRGMLEDEALKLVTLEKLHLPVALVPKFYGYKRELSYFCHLTQPVTSLKKYFEQYPEDKENPVKAYAFAKTILEKIILLNQYRLEQSDLDLKNIMLTDQNEVVFWPSLNFRVFGDRDYYNNPVPVTEKDYQKYLAAAVRRFGFVLWELFSDLPVPTAPCEIPAEIPLKIAKLIACCWLPSLPVTVNELLREFSSEIDYVSHDLMHLFDIEKENLLCPTIENETRAAGMRFPVTTPYYISPPDKQAVTAWIQNQATPEMRAIALKIASGINHIDFISYLACIGSNVEAFEDRVKGSYALLVLSTEHPNLNSSAWVSSIALSKGGLRWPTGIVTPNTLDDFLKKKPAVQHILVWSDCARGYTYFIKALQEMCQKSTAHERLRECQLHMSIPVLRTDDYEGIRYNITINDTGFPLNYWFKEASLLPFVSVPLLRDILHPAEYAQFDAVTGVFLLNKDLTYFNHYFSPDRTLSHLMTGRNLIHNDDFLNEEKEDVAHLTLVDSQPLVPYVQQLYQPMKQAELHDFRHKIESGRVGLRTTQSLPLELKHPEALEKKAAIEVKCESDLLLGYKMYAPFPDFNTVEAFSNEAGISLYKFSWLGRSVLAKVVKLGNEAAPAIASLEREIKTLIEIDALQVKDLPILKWVGYKRTHEYFASVYESPHELSNKFSNRSADVTYVLASNMIQVLKSFHDLHFYHGDLRLETFLFDANLNIVILSNFAMASALLKSASYSMEADIYSFGKMLWKLFTRNITREKIPVEPWDDALLPVKMAKLIQWCLQPEPQDRPTTDQLLNEFATPSDDVSGYLTALNLKSTLGAPLAKFSASQVQAAQLVSLDLVSSLPTQSCYLDQAAAKQWVKNQYTPELRNVAQKIIDNVQCITMEAYLLNLKKMIADFHEKVKGPYAIILPPGTWLTQVALNIGLCWPAAMVSVGELKQFVFKNPHIKQFLILNNDNADAMYIFMVSVNRELFNDRTGCYYDYYQIYLGLPYSFHRDLFINLMGADYEKIKLCYLHTESVRPLSEFLPPHIHPCVESKYLNRCLTYFSHHPYIENIEELVTGRNLQSKDDKHFYESVEYDKKSSRGNSLFYNLPAGLTYDVKPVDAYSGPVVCGVLSVNSQQAFLMSSSQPESEEKKSDNLVSPQNVNVIRYELGTSFASGFPKLKHIYERTSTGVYESNWVGNKVAVKLGQYHSHYEHNMRHGLEREAGVYIKFDALNITDLPIPKFYGCGATPRYFIIAIQYFPRGSLDQYVKDKASAIQDENERFRLAYDFSIKAAKALLIFHKHGLFHGDLKPANMLVDDKEEVVISDLSSVRFSDDKRDYNGGTPAYVSPECLEKNPPNLKSDIYSLGNIIWQFFANKSPYEGMASKKIYELVKTDKPDPVLPNFPTGIAALINKCRQFKPEERPNCVEVLQELSKRNGVT